MDARDACKHAGSLGSAGGVKVAFSDVHFRYTQDEGSGCLTGVDFCADPGDFVAFVGPSGSGKSTCTKLLLRLYDVHSGSVQVGGVDVRSVTQDSLRNTVGLVP